ncbi:hypothetical protein I2I05_06270 [Hymenobacter sp. BT683]|uniref:Uncharacterized protein n=1 Tax=Hymenobacter jeongseonensis TaxID=2791027 RepID=A0ABS0IF63_9BACT|nr:hypothetical protein [Hymenobacter jeongseonensis]MBF9236996.1 hypothetical protein [Hymenobacter jeongseonensis]
MDFKYFLKERKNNLVYLRYKLIVLAGMGFEKQYKYFPDAVFEKHIFKIKLNRIKWAHSTKIVTAPRMLVNGEWDIHSKMPVHDFLRKNDSCNTIFQIYSEGLPFQESDQYKSMKRYIDSGIIGPGWQARGCKSVQDIDMYFKRLEKHFDNIKRNGYKAQSELGSNRFHDELTVSIDRNGEFHKQEGEGHHRLAIAVLLNIPTVPVAIKRIHKNWAKEQFKKHKADLLTSLKKSLAASSDDAASYWLSTHTSEGIAAQSAASQSSQFSASLSWPYSAG